jgi:hypothetical protein
MALMRAHSSVRFDPLLAHSRHNGSTRRRAQIRETGGRTIAPLPSGYSNPAASNVASASSWRLHRDQSPHQASDVDLRLLLILAWRCARERTLGAITQRPRFEPEIPLVRHQSLGPARRG